VQHKTRVNNLVHNWQVGDGEFGGENFESLLNNANKILDSNAEGAPPKVRVSLYQTQRTLRADANDARADEVTVACSCTALDFADMPASYRH
jgi:hypothetical protein